MRSIFRVVGTDYPAQNGTYGAAAAAAGPMRTEPLGRGLGRPFGSPAA